jgi:hypothetical protein
VGELLEVGAAAERARTTLSAAGHDAGSVGRLVGDLRAQAEGARRTEDEMGLKRRGAAAQRA